MRPTAGRLFMPRAFSSANARYRSTHIFLSGSGPSSYSRVIFSLVVVEELDFCVKEGGVRKLTGKRKTQQRGVVHKAPALPFWIRVWGSRPLCCSFSEPGSFCPSRTLSWEPFLMEKRGRAVEEETCLQNWNFQNNKGRGGGRHSPGVLLAMLPPMGYGPGPGPGPPWFIIPCMLFMPGPYGEPAPIMPWDMFG